MTWTNATGRKRDLVFYAFAQDPGGRDVWRPIVGGSHAAIEEVARHHARHKRTKVLVIALHESTPAPDGASERDLLRMGQPWY